MTSLTVSEILDLYKEAIKYLHFQIKDQNLTPDEILEKEDAITYQSEHQINELIREAKSLTMETLRQHIFNQIHEPTMQTESLLKYIDDYIAHLKETEVKDDKCGLCGASPMTANCNNAGCDK